MKKGISAIVAVVLMVLIVVAGVGLVWGVILPFLNQDVKISDSAVTVDTDGGYTFYDEETEIACVQITRNEEVIDGVKIIFVIAGESYPLTINASDLPEPNGQKRYCVNLSSFGDSPSGNLVPIVGGNSGGGSAFDIIVRPFAPKALESLTSGGGKIYRVDGDPNTPDEVITFMKTFGGDGYDKAYSVQQTNDGGYIIGGETGPYGNGLQDFWLVKTNSVGDEEWNKAFSVGDHDIAYSVQQTSDGGYVIAGEAWVSDGVGYDFWLIKTNSTGHEQWNKTYGGEGGDTAYSVQQTKDAGYIITGVTQIYRPDATYYEDFWLIKTNSTGDEEWNKTFGGNGYDEAKFVQQTKDGGYIVVGNTQDDITGSLNFWLIKTNSTGHEQWNKTFGGNSMEMVHSVQQTSDDGYIIAGDTESYGEGSNDFWLIKTNSEGIEQWNKTFGGSKVDIARSAQQTSDDGYIIAGGIMYPDILSLDFWLIKTNSTGHEQWNKTFGGDGYEAAYSVQQTKDGGYILVGWNTFYNTGDSDALLIKTNSTGDVI